MKIMKQKIEVIDTIVNLKHDGLFYRVIMTGEHGNIKCSLFKEGEFLKKYTKDFGHANKTAAIRILEQYLSNH